MHLFLLPAPAIRCANSRMRRSAKNRCIVFLSLGSWQAVHVYVLESADARAKVAGLTKYGFNAPVILCVCAETDRTWKNPLEDGITSAEQDAAIVATHMMLAAWEEGIGSCWVGYFPPSKLAEVLGLAQNHKPVLLMPMGYPAEDAAPSPLHEKTRSLDELVTTL